MEVDVDQLREAVESQHGGKATALASVEVHEEFEGQTVWRGLVHVFLLENHPTANRAYAWSHAVGDDGDRRRFVTVLHVGQVNSPLNAVRAALVAEQRERRS